jgi:hypothetical protein
LLATLDLERIEDDVLVVDGGEIGGMTSEKWTLL